MNNLTGFVHRERENLTGEEEAGVAAQSYPSEASEREADQYAISLV